MYPPDSGLNLAQHRARLDVTEQLGIVTSYEVFVTLLLLYCSPVFCTVIVNIIIAYEYCRHLYHFENCANRPYKNL